MTLCNSFNPMLYVLLHDFYLDINNIFASTHFIIIKISTELKQKKKNCYSILNTPSREVFVNLLAGIIYRLHLQYLHLIWHEWYEECIWRYNHVTLYLYETHILHKLWLTVLNIWFIWKQPLETQVLQVKVFRFIK